MSVNSVNVSGRTTRDCEVKDIGNGRKVANFDIAVNKVWFNAEREKQEKVSYITCQVFGPRADFAGKALLKGTQVFVSGSLDQQSWEDKDGSKRSKIVVTVDDFDLGKETGNGQKAETVESQTATTAKTGSKKKEEIPF